jgi:hypothetical protein
MASASSTPSASRSSSGSSGAISPSIARVPKKLPVNRLLSSSHSATTSSVLAGVPWSRRAASAASPPTTPSAPSYRPPEGTVSTCEPVSTTRSDSPGSRPNTLPTASTRACSPASPIHRSRVSRARCQASSYWNRYRPPDGDSPIRPSSSM